MTQEVQDSLKMVAPPGEHLIGFDDRMLYEDAIKVMENPDFGIRYREEILAELEKMK